MSRVFEVWRLYDDAPGCVDFLGEIKAESVEVAEDIGRLRYSFDYGAGEQIDVNELLPDDPDYPNAEPGERSGE